MSNDTKTPDITDDQREAWRNGATLGEVEAMASTAERGVILKTTPEAVKPLPVGTIVKKLTGPFANHHYVKTGSNTYAYLDHRTDGLQDRADTAVLHSINNVSPFPYDDSCSEVEIVNPQRVIEGMVKQAHLDRAALDRKTAAETRVYSLARHIEQIEEFVKDPDGFIEAAIADSNA